MPVGLGLAASHAPNVFIPPDRWEKRYRAAIADIPPPPQVKDETPEVRAAIGRRIDTAFDVLRDRLAAYSPDALVMVTDDHDEMFDSNLINPQIAIFLGKRGLGLMNLTDRKTLDDPTAEPIVLECHEELSRFIADGLVQRDFDIAVSRQEETHSVGKVDRGMGHGFTRTSPRIMPALDIPVVLIWLNCYFEPLPTARRCLDLGRAVADVCMARPERIAILGTGGLSHDPRGPRAGWIDEPLDRAVLDAFAAGDPYRLESLYKIPSDTYHGGTGEIRSWLAVGGAMGKTKATIVDYIAAYHIITGVGFAYWETE